MAIYLEAYHKLSRLNSLLTKVNDNTWHWFRFEKNIVTRDYPYWNAWENSYW
jgi:hypothetical protein